VLLPALLLALPFAARTQAVPARLEGLVVDALRRPVPSARVVLGEISHATVYYFGVPETTYAATPGIADAERSRYAAEIAADGEGRFQVSGLVAGEYSAVATDAERGIALATFRVGDPGAPALVLELKPPAFLEAEIHGLERDPSIHIIQLKPVGVGSNLWIVPRLEERGKSWSFTSTALPSVPSWRILGTENVLAQDYHALLFAWPVTLAPGKRLKLDLELAGGKSMSGVVADAEGKALSGVSVVARSPDPEGYERGAVTDSNGRYTIRGLTEGAYLCEAARWILRETRGCGVGFQDVLERKKVLVPLPRESDGDFRVAETVPRPQVGKEAPNFQATTTDGRTIELRALRGKVVLLDFWATWCPLCRGEMPRLTEMYAERAKGGKFEIVGVSVDEDVGLVPRFAASRGLVWPQTALGPEARNPIAKLYNAHSTPMTVLVDAEGRIAAVNVLGEELRAKVAELIGAK
jgi:peroxiredoxin